MSIPSEIMPASSRPVAEAVAAAEADISVATLEAVEHLVVVEPDPGEEANTLLWREIHEATAANITGESAAAKVKTSAFRRRLAAGATAVAMMFGGTAAAHGTTEATPLPDGVAEVAQLVTAQTDSARLDEIREAYRHSAQLMGYGKKHEVIYAHAYGDAAYKKELATSLGVTVPDLYIDDLLRDSLSGNVFVSRGKKIRSHETSTIPFDVYVARTQAFAAQYGLTISFDTHPQPADMHTPPITDAYAESLPTKQALVNFMRFLAQQPVSVPPAIGWKRVVFNRNPDYSGASSPDGTMYLNLDAQPGSHVEGHEEGHLTDFATAPGSDANIDPQITDTNAVSYDALWNHKATGVSLDALQDPNALQGSAVDYDEMLSTEPKLQEVSFATTPPDVAEDKAEEGVPLYNPYNGAVGNLVQDSEPRLQAKTLLLYGRWAERMLREVAYLLLAQNQSQLAEPLQIDNPYLRAARKDDWHAAPQYPGVSATEVLPCGVTSAERAATIVTALGTQR